MPHRQLTYTRLDVQDRARRLRKEPQAEGQEKLEKMRHLLTVQLGIIDSLRQRIDGASGSLNALPDMNDPSAFDDIDDENSAGPYDAAQWQHSGQATEHQGDQFINAASKTADSDMSLPEFWILPIPSTIRDPLDHHREVEIRLRHRQADGLLTLLRELIAEKSFHYSHILRLSKHQSTRSRARSKIAGLNAEISLCCRAYTRCRTAMSRLHGPGETPKRYLPIDKNDIKASTALLDPNKPGSSKLRLSWIWQTQNPGQESATDTLTECMPLYISVRWTHGAYPMMTVQRVHWLRARAQNGRWNEETILVGYEMRWTVRYFLHKAEQWDHLGAGNESSGLAPGPAAYAARKAAMWRWVASKAKKHFVRANKDVGLEDVVF